MIFTIRVSLFGLLVFGVSACLTVNTYGYTYESINLSTCRKATLGGICCRDGDLFDYNPKANTAKLFFSEDLFSHNEDIDAVSVLVNGNIVLSTKGPATLGGLRFKDGDLVEYDPLSDTASLLFSESLFSHNEDIDAVSVLENGNIVLSTRNPATLGGLRFKDGDLVEYDPLSETASLLFSEDLFSHNEDIDAIHIPPDGSIILSTKARAKLGGIRFRRNDLVLYDFMTNRSTLYLSGDCFQSACTNINAVSAIPEPATFLLLGLGGVILKKQLRI